MYLNLEDPNVLPMLVRKWSPLHKHLKGQETKELVAICAENVQKHMDVQEAQGDLPVGRFSRYALPIVSRVARDLTLSDLVSIQPLGQPDGKIFFVDFLYSQTKGTITAGDNVVDKLDPTYTADPGKGGAASRMKLSVQSSPVTVTSKKITGDAYVEDIQDLFTYYGVRGEAELVQAMAIQIQRETNKAVIDDMLANFTAGSVSFDVSVPTTGAYAVIDPKIYKKQVFDAFVDADNLIFKKRSVTPNWLVAGSDFAAFIEKLDDFKADNTPDMNRQNIGLHRIGVFRGRWVIYKYAFMPNNNEAIMGYKGATRFDTGYVHAPYLMGYLTPPFTDPNTLTVSRGLMNRSAEHLVSGDFYVKITLNNL